MQRTDTPQTSSRDDQQPKPFNVPRPTPQNAQPTIAQSNLDPALTMAGNGDWQLPGESSPHAAGLDDFNFNSMAMDMGNTVDANFTWEMIGLGLEEPLPTQETIDELHRIYFDKVHPSIPMVHKYRYLAAMNLCVRPYSTSPNMNTVLTATMAGRRTNDPQSV